MIGFRTIRTGERAAVWDAVGRVRFLDGPRRVFLFRETLQPLPRFTAEADEYLVVKFRDGRAEHIPGPATVFFDPAAHEEVRVEKALAVDGHEAVVVYRRVNGAVERRIVRGPALYVPGDREWLHEFVWHGADPRSPSDPRNPHRKVPRALRFTKLWTIPDQMYFDVPDVRTADDALLVVKLMVFFELADIEAMLDATHDPVADFINAVSADVIDFAAARSFEVFKAGTDALNELETYASLTRRGERIGYRITKVVYRGYYASEKLQAMHDAAIEARTRLKLEAETEAQAQELADLKLAREGERAIERRKLEETQARHEASLRRLADEETLREADEHHRSRLNARRSADELNLARRQAANRERLGLWSALRDMQVDLTRYLVAQQRQPDRLIRIDGGAERPRVHLHEG